MSPAKLFADSASLRAGYGRHMKPQEAANNKGGQQCFIEAQSAPWR